MILITGATGLVGSHLAISLLENGASIRAIYRTDISIQKTKSVFELHKKSHFFDKIEWVQADINDISALEIAFQGIEYVYHCAALVSFDPKDEDRMRKINIEGTANIVNFCLSNNVKKLCHVSSIAALGDKLEHEKMITEETEWNPEKSHSDYAISKYGAEIEVFRAQQEGLNVVIVNPGVIIGAGFWESGSGEIFKTINNGIPFYTNGSTGFVSVEDLVKTMITLMKNDNNGEKFILIAENCTYKFIAYTICEALSVEKPKHEVSKSIVIAASKLDWLFSKLFFLKRKLTSDVAKSLFNNDLYDNQKIKIAIDCKFESVAATIHKTAIIFKNR